MSRRRHRHGLIVGVLAFSGATAAFVQTLVIAVIADIPAIFTVTSSESAWVITASLLTAAVVSPLAGRLGDLYGKRNVVVVLVAVTVAGSVVGALAPTLEVMIVGRAMQGFMFGFVPLAIGILRDLLAPARLGRSVALVSGTLGVGGAIAFPVAGMLYEAFGWEALFWTAAALSSTALVLLVAVLPGGGARAIGTFDIAGAVLLSLGLVGTLLALSKGPVWGWQSAATLACGLGGLALLVVWIEVERRVASPLVDLRLVFRRRLSLTNLSSFAFGFSSLGFQIVVPVIVQLPAATGYGFSQSVAVAGLCMAPSGFMMLASSPIAVGIAARFGPRISVFAGGLTIASGYVLGAVLMSELWQVVVVCILIGIGSGLVFAATPLLIVAAVPLADTGAANGLNALIRLIGSSIGAMVVGVLLGAFLTDFGGHSIPSRAGPQLVYLACAGVMIVGAVGALLIPRAGGRGTVRPRITGPDSSAW